jgi:hypothetical protein
MLNDYFLLLQIVRMRQQEMLQQAEADRLYRQLKENRPGLLQQIGCWLAGTVRQLKTHSQLNTATPILGQK